VVTVTGRESASRVIDIHFPNYLKGAHNWPRLLQLMVYLKAKSGATTKNWSVLMLIPLLFGYVYYRRMQINGSWPKLNFKGLCGKIASGVAVAIVNSTF